MAWLEAVARDRSKTAATSKMEQFVIIFNGWKLLTIIPNSAIFGCCSSPRSASGRLEVFCKKSGLGKFSGKQLRQSLFFNKVAGLRHSTWWDRAPSTLITERLQIELLLLLRRWENPSSVAVSHFLCWSKQEEPNRNRETRVLVFQKIWKHH